MFAPFPLHPSILEVIVSVAPAAFAQTPVDPALISNPKHCAML
jgi:hypothetical protein